MSGSYISFQIFGSCPSSTSSNPKRKTPPQFKAEIN
jgi:hypothetical protein